MRLVQCDSGAIKPAEFDARLSNSITALHEITGNQVAASDGKTLHRTFAATSKLAIPELPELLATSGRC